MKVCSRCRVEQAADAFYKYARSSDGLQPYCKKCNLAYKKHWDADNREKLAEQKRRYAATHADAIAAYQREYRLRREAQLRAMARRRHLWRMYKITPEEWDGLFASQGHACAICRSSNPGRAVGIGWHTDHCHETGRVRGILCHHCNVSLGYVRDSPELLLRLHTYLVQPSYLPPSKKPHPGDSEGSVSHIDRA